MSKAVKTKLYKTIMTPVVLYGGETWAMTEMDRKRLSTCEKKILRRMYGPVVEQGLWRIKN
jgi:hypothetical protein